MCPHKMIIVNIDSSTIIQNQAREKLDICMTETPRQTVSYASTAIGHEYVFLNYVIYSYYHGFYCSYNPNIGLSYKSTIPFVH